MREAHFTKKDEVWSKEGKYGKVFATITPKGSTDVEVVARFVRADGTAICQIQA